MYIICYEDYCFQKGYEETDLEPKEWVKQNPTLNLVYAFNREQDVLYKDSKEEREFITLCNHYGFETDDYKREIVNGKGEKLVFIGFLPQNRKYKCKLINLDTGRGVKATTDWVQVQLRSN